MTHIRAIVFLLLVFPAVSLFAQMKPRLAILPFTGDSDGDGETMLFSCEPELSAVFTIIPRTSSIEAIMREQQFRLSSGLTDADTIARLGRQYNADYVMAGHIRTLGDSKLVLITIIHVESLRQIAGDYKEYTDIEEVRAMIPGMAQRIAAASRISGAALPQLAVLPFAAPEGMEQGDAEVLAWLLAAEIANSGKYAVLPRTATIRSVMAEHLIRLPWINEAYNIGVIGKALNARYALALSVRDLGRASLLTAEILDIENASRMAGNTVNYRALGDGIKLMAELGAKLTGGAALAMSVPANMVLVEGGTFQMGSNNGYDDEKPVHTVTVKSFYMGKYEVTQKEWAEVMGTTMQEQWTMAGYSGSPERGAGDDYPVYSVNWYEAVEYCNRLSLKEGLIPAYRGSWDSMVWDFNATGYRLPTEAEWEYAAKGGNKDSIPYEYAGGNNVDAVAWYEKNSGDSSHPAGTKQPNSLGLYDMIGNVGEWCWDWKGNYSGESQNDPIGPSGPTFSRTNRVARGGGWGSYDAVLRPAKRDSYAPSIRNYNRGFRLVRPQL